MGEPWWVTALVALACAWAGYWVGRVRERKRHRICVNPEIRERDRLLMPINHGLPLWWWTEEDRFVEPYGGNDP